MEISQIEKNIEPLRKWLNDPILNIRQLNTKLGLYPGALLGFRAGRHGLSIQKVAATIEVAKQYGFKPVEQ